MKLKVTFEEHDINAIQEIVRQRSHRRFVAMRIERNVSGTLPRLDKEALWHVHMMCLLTTQQRSGPNSPINQILNKTPFPLSLERCRNADTGEIVLSTLREVKGVRFAPKISQRAVQNLSELENGGWRGLMAWVDRLQVQRLEAPNEQHYVLERQAANYMAGNYQGFGPKQSRNFWQSLGLTRYEFVLDSRVLRWLRDQEFPIPLSSMGLGEEDYYCFVSNILRQLCIEAGVLPCVFDAAVFDSNDTEEWPLDTIVW